MKFATKRTDYGKCDLWLVNFFTSLSQIMSFVAASVVVLPPGDLTRKGPHSAIARFSDQKTTLPSFPSHCTRVRARALLPHLQRAVVTHSLTPSGTHFPATLTENPDEGLTICRSPCFGAVYAPQVVGSRYLCGLKQLVHCCTSLRCRCFL